MRSTAISSQRAASRKATVDSLRTLSSRERIIRATSDLLKSNGYHGTGLNEIVRKGKAPKGSIYYHFPRGKRQIAAEAILLTARTLAEVIRANFVKKHTAAEAVHSYVDGLALLMQASGFRSGGPLMLVASETATTDKLLNQSCRQAYDLILETFKDQLSAFGFPAAQAEVLAVGIAACIDGGIILSRTYHSRKPLRTVAKLLDKMVQAMDLVSDRHS